MAFRTVLEKEWIHDDQARCGGLGPRAQGGGRGRTGGAPHDVASTHGSLHSSRPYRAVTTPAAADERRIPRSPRVPAMVRTSVRWLVAHRPKAPRAMIGSGGG